LTTAKPVHPGRPAEARPKPQVVADVREEEQTPWRVFLFNDDVHSFEEVIAQVAKATGCPPSRAAEIAWQAHTEGKAVAFEGEFAECYRVQGVLREIELITEIRG
jgi:ATP-dependent Clp protease adaptor protein ClpS